MAGPIARLLPPVALFAGVFLFGVSMFVLGVEAAGEEPQPLDPSSLTSENGTGLLVYQVDRFTYGSRRVEVSYTFPQAPGDAYVVDCEDHEAMLRGDPPARPYMAFTGLAEGSFVVSDRTLPAASRGEASGDPPPDLARACETVLAFRWPATDGNAMAGRPDASVSLHQRAFDAGRYDVLLALMAMGGVLALSGGLAWARVRATGVGLPDRDESPLEVLRTSLDRLGEQLERTRRHLLFAGVLGVFLWYPVLIPWTWKQAARTSDHVLFPWAVAGLTLAFLLVLTGLWARELHRLDRELVAWRGRMGELRDREALLMDTLQQGR